MLDWFNAREVTEVGAALADDFATRVAPAASRGKHSNGTSGALERLLHRADSEVRPLGLNFYRKAKFANSFKWRLIENGVAKEVADEVTQQLIVHLSLGRTKSEEGPAEVASAQAPSETAALFTEGTRCLSEGRYAEAIRSYQELLRMDPQHADGLNNLGAAFCKVGRYDEAQSCFQQAINAQPNYAEAYNNLGNVLRWKGMVEDAETLFRRALKLKPSYLNARTNLGLALTFLGRSHEAERQFNIVLESAPQNTQALYGMGQVAAIQGRFDEAEALYRRALEVNGAMCDALLGITGLRKMTAADGDWLAQAEKVAATKGLTPLDEVDVRYALGKYYDDIGDFARAFPHYRRANELQKAVAPPYDRAARAAFVDEMIRIYSPAAVSSVRAGSSTSVKPILVVGMPRSGTSLVEQIIASHRAAQGAGELTFWNDAMSAHRAAIAQDFLSKTARRKLAEGYLRVLEGRCPDAERVVDKAPVDSDYLGLIHEVFPNARIVHLRRDPVDTCLSIYFQKFSPGLNFSMDLSDLAHYYREHARLMAHWHSVLPAGTILEVSYCDLLTDQETWTRKILEFLGLDWDARCLEFEKTERPVATSSYWQVRQKIYKSSIARWRNYEAFIAPLLELRD